MTKMILLTLTITLMILLSGCLYLNEDMISKFGNSQEVTQLKDERAADVTTSDIKDCENDMDCLIEASKTCDPAQMRLVTYFRFMGVNQTTTNYFEIKGEESGKCVFYNQIEKIQLDYPEEMPEDSLRSSKSAVSSLEGKDQTCYFDKDRLTTVLQNWKQGKYSSKDWMDANCTGSMYETYGQYDSSYETDLSDDKLSFNVTLKPSMETKCFSGYKLENGKCVKEEDEPACIEEKNYNIYSRGTVRYEKGDYKTTMTDYCKNSREVNEYYCNGASVYVNTVSCPSGYSCSNGACVKKYACSGSTTYGSIYLKTYRYIHQGTQTYTYSDYCRDSDTVTKAYCNGDTVSYGDVNCPSGYQCSNGACVPKPSSYCSGPTYWSKYYQNVVYYHNGYSGTNYYDYCKNSYQAKKYYCNGNSLVSITVSCPSGYSCRSSGVCTRTTTSGCSSGSCGSSSSSSSSSSGCSGSSCGTSGSTSSGSSGSTSSGSSSGGCSGGSCPNPKGPTVTEKNESITLTDEQLREISKQFNERSTINNFPKINFTISD
jgi:hypothetical protein